MAHWYSIWGLNGLKANPYRVEEAWPGAPIENGEVLQMLLDVAREQVLAFAPDAEPALQVTELLQDLGVEEEAIASVLALLDFEAIDAEPPSRYVYAQLMQAKTLWKAGMADENGNAGTEGFSFVPRPLDKTIRAIIRPTSGVASAF